MKKIIFLILGIFSFCSTNSQINFKNFASEKGLNLNTGSTEYGSGVSFCDFDNDGWDDISVATDEGQTIRFFKNNGGDFSEVFFNIVFENSVSKQINWVDIDNDGDKDLFVTSNSSGNKLYRNDGEFNLFDITSDSGLYTNNLETSGTSWGDYNNDGFLDVFITNRGEINPQQNFLFKNNGNYTFSDVTSEAGIDNESHLSFCSAFFDFNNDGLQDIYVSNDKFQNQNFLYKNNGDGTFSDVSDSSGTNITIDAMTTTIGDFNNDGWFDIYISNTPSGNVLFLNNQDETFTNVAETTGTEFNSFGWGAVFLDAENDMDLDLYVSGSFDGSNQNLISAAFYNNDSGVFTQSSTNGFDGDTNESYSNAIGDINNDGFPEILVNNGGDENISLWENDANQTNNWLKIKLIGSVSNKDAIGSRIELSVNNIKQYRYTHSGEGFLAQNSSSEFFGLGANSQVDYLKINWLSGLEEYFYDISSNQILEIIEGTGTLSLLENKIIEQKTSAFPNPTNSKIKIESNKLLLNLQVIDSFGNLVSEIEDINRFNFELDLTFLNSGVYLLKYSTNIQENIVKVIKL